MVQTRRITLQDRAQDAVFYSLASARVLRLIGAPLSAAERSHSDIITARDTALEEITRTRRIAEVIALMRERFGHDGR
ncbi:hypothetical protein [Marinovum sp.]|uniref:hypothetical protein n=1 Tax=Marinovum sp. TaxID=2024839 RepID=UPI003A952BD5